MLWGQTVRGVVGAVGAHPDRLDRLALPRAVGAVAVDGPRCPIPAESALWGQGLPPPKSGERQADMGTVAGGQPCGACPAQELPGNRLNRLQPRPHPRSAQSPAPPASTPFLLSAPGNRLRDKPTWNLDQFLALSSSVISGRSVRLGRDSGFLFADYFWSPSRPHTPWLPGYRCDPVGQVEQE